MSKHMRFFKHEIPLDPIKAFSASDMYTAEWIMFITHFTLPLGSASGEILSSLMQSELWIQENWNIWPGFSAVPQEVRHERFRSESWGAKASPWRPVRAQDWCPSEVTPGTRVRWPGRSPQLIPYATGVQRGNCSSCMLARVSLRAGNRSTCNHTAAWWSSVWASCMNTGTHAAGMGYGGGKPPLGLGAACCGRPKGRGSLSAPCISQGWVGSQPCLSQCLESPLNSHESPLNCMSFPSPCIVKISLKERWFLSLSFRIEV